jgi:hypothetical protein
MINDELLNIFQKKENYSQNAMNERDNEMSRIILSLVFHNIRKVVTQSKIYLNP